MFVRFIFAGFLLVAGFSLPVIASAQSADLKQCSLAVPGRFSLAPAITAEQSVSPDSVISIPLTFQSTYDHYLPDITIYAAVYEGRDANQSSLVDWFVVDEFPFVTPEQETSVRFTWDAENRPAGEYITEFYVRQGDQASAFAQALGGRESLSSLSFVVTPAATDTGFLSRDTFRINGQVVGSQVVIDNPFDQQVAQARFAEIADTAFQEIADEVQQQELTAAITVVNPGTSGSLRGTFTWELYRGRVPDQNNLMLTEMSEVKLTPGTSRDYELTFDELSWGEYLLLGILETEAGTKHYLSLVLQDDVMSVPQTNSHIDQVGVAGLAGGSDDALRAYFCFGNYESDPRVFNTNTRLEANLVITNLVTNQQETIAEFDDILDITRINDLALTVPLVGITDAFALTAQLVQNGVIVDEVQAAYDCQDLGITCEKLEGVFVAEPDDNNSILFIALSIVLAMFIVYAVAHVRMRQAKVAAEETVTNNESGL